jgi:alkylation response protein AidB-like acyl-CoA dehydrogenase
LEVTNQILAAVDRWLEREVAPHAAKLEHEDVWPAAMVEGMKKLGLFGSTISPEYGGLGLSAGVYTQIVSRISEVWMSLTGIFNSHLMMALLVEKYGSPFLKETFLPRFASGEIRGGLALTEPNAGTDLQAIRLRARREGDSYVLNGTKTWISNGIQGSCFAVLAKTDPDAQPRHKGMAMLLCEKGPGFGASRKLEKLGYKGIDSAELVFQDYRVPAGNLIGEEGRGFHQAVGGLELGRLNVAARGVGVAKAALDEAVRYSQQRQTFGKPICEHQAIQLKLGEMATRLEAARLLVKKVLRHRGGVRERARGDAHPRRLRLLQGIRGRAPVSRRAAPLHRRGHQRDAAHHRRPPTHPA